MVNLLAVNSRYLGLAGVVGFVVLVKIVEGNS